jgi:hypothetical protein
MFDGVMRHPRQGSSRPPGSTPMVSCAAGWGGNEYLVHGWQLLWRGCSGSELQCLAGSSGKTFHHNMYPISFPKICFQNIYWFFAYQDAPRKKWAKIRKIEKNHGKKIKNKISPK